MVACSTYDAYRHTHQDFRATDSGVTLRWRCRPRSPHRDCPATCNILLRRGNPALRSRSQPEEDRGSPPARPPGSVLPTPHYNWRDRTEGSPTVHLPGVHHLLWCKNRQRGGQQTGKGKQCFWQTSQSGLEQQAPEESHKDQCVQSRGTNHPPVWLRVVGHLQTPPTTPGTFSPTVSPLHPQHPLERLHHKRWSASTSRDHQCRGHADENTATLGRARLQNGGSPPTQDRPLRWTLHRAPWQRSTKEEVQRLSEKIPVYLPHRPSTVVSPCCWPRGLATCRSPVSLLLWEQP